MISSIYRTDRTRCEMKRPFFLITLPKLHLMMVSPFQAYIGFSACYEVPNFYISLRYLQISSYQKAFHGGDLVKSNVTQSDGQSRKKCGVMA